MASAAAVSMIMHDRVRRGIGAAMVMLGIVWLFAEGTPAGAFIAAGGLMMMFRTQVGPTRRVEPTRLDPFAIQAWIAAALSLAAVGIGVASGTGKGYAAAVLAGLAAVVFSSVALRAGARTRAGTRAGPDEHRHPE